MEQRTPMTGEPLLACPLCGELHLGRRPVVLAPRPGGQAELVVARRHATFDPARQPR